MQIHLLLIAWLAVAGLCAAVGNYSYSYMEARLRKSGAHIKSKLLKYPTDFWAVYLQYRSLMSVGDAPSWPAKTFLVSVAGIVLSILYILLVPKPF